MEVFSYIKLKVKLYALTLKEIFIRLPKLAKLSHKLCCSLNLLYLLYNYIISVIQQV